MVKIIPITDFDAPELDVYARLTENQLLCREHPEQGLFIAESPVVIERALDAGFMPVSFLLETRHVEGQAKPLLAQRLLKLQSAAADVGTGAAAHLDLGGMRNIRPRLVDLLSVDVDLAAHDDRLCLASGLAKPT